MMEKYPVRNEVVLLRTKVRERDARQLRFNENMKNYTGSHDLLITGPRNVLQQYKESSIDE